MSKKPMTWLGLIKEKLAEEKAKGNAPSINDIMPIAKKEWAQIKSGSHPKYEQGKAQTFARKKKGDNKTKKLKGGAKSKTMSSSPDIHAVLHEAKICTKCKKKVEKLMKKKGMSGGGIADGAAPVGGDPHPPGGCNGNCKASQSGGSCGGTCCLGGT